MYHIDYVIHVIHTVTWTTVSWNDKPSDTKDLLPQHCCCMGPKTPTPRKHNAPLLIFTAGVTGKLHIRGKNPIQSGRDSNSILVWSCNGIRNQGPIWSQEYGKTTRAFAVYGCVDHLHLMRNAAGSLSTRAHVYAPRTAMHYPMICLLLPQWGRCLRVRLHVQEVYCLEVTKWMFL